MLSQNDDVVVGGSQPTNLDVSMHAMQVLYRLSMVIWNIISYSLEGYQVSPAFQCPSSLQTNPNRCPRSVRYGADSGGICRTYRKVGRHPRFSSWSRACRSILAGRVTSYLNQSTMRRH